MNFSTMMMYWIVKLDDIRVLLDFTAFMSVLALIALWGFAYVVEAETNYVRKAIIITKVLGALIIVLMVVRFFLPSTKQLASILVLPKIINNEQVQELPNKILDLSTAWIEELKPHKSE